MLRLQISLRASCHPALLLRSSSLRFTRPFWRFLHPQLRFKEPFKPGAGLRVGTSCSSPGEAEAWSWPLFPHAAVCMLTGRLG